MATRQKRTREQVHQDGGHTAFVASCSMCVTEAEADRQAELARAAEGTEPAETPAAARRQLADDGRPKCVVPACILPEFMDGIGVCGGHYATHRGYANKRSG